MEIKGPTPPSLRARRGRAIAAGASFAALTMLGLAFASKPFYDIFCRVTGYGGTVQIAKAGPGQVAKREIDIRFDADAARGLPLTFKPIKSKMRLRLGQIGLAFFEVGNETDRPIRAIASYNVTPHEAGRFFQKLECFCFSERTFQPGERAELPVLFFVDPDIVSDRFAKKFDTITLSYTFFEVGDPAFELAQAPVATPGAVRN